MSLSSSRRTALAVTLFLPALLLLALPFYKPGDLPYLLLMIGRFHPVILHFPIVLIILAFILELLRKLKVLKTPDFVVLTILRSEEHTSELQSQSNLVCRLLLEK